MTIIKDDLLEPYFIGKDSHCYTAYEVITPQAKYLEKGSEGKNYEKPIGHYSDFGQALHSIMKAKLNRGDKEYSSVKEYLSEWNKIKKELQTLTEITKL
jgi:hypothetical protein|tara:strand:- start:66 stop:362 length:297 start_codon:yes stop_codon:yes gene_type:complete